MEKTIMLSICSCLLPSCNLNLQSKNELTYSNSLNKKKGLNAATISILYYINTVVGNNHVLSTASMKADGILDDKQLCEWSPRTVIRSEYSWKGPYDIIFELNLLLGNIDKIKDLAEDRREYHVGQAEFVPGLSYFLLAQRYDETITTDNSSEIEPYSLSSQNDVLNAATKHAKKILGILPTWNKLTDLNGTSITSCQTALKNTAAALLTQIYTWKGSVTEFYRLQGNAQEDYQKSIDHSIQVINGQVSNYQLCSSLEELCTYLSNEKSPNSKIIFNLYFDETCSEDVVSPDEVAQSFVSWPVGEDQTLAGLPPSSTYRLYTSTTERLFPDTTDQRLQTLFYQWGTSHEVDGTDHVIMHKFRKVIMDTDQYSANGRTYRAADTNYVYWRPADFYLLKVEYYQKLGSEAKTTTDFNMIRSRTGTFSYPPAYDTEGLEKAIFLEREKEFIGENGARYADVIRNGYVEEELRGKFRLLTNQDIQGGALPLPLPRDVQQDKDGHTINTLLRQEPYWRAYN